MPRPTEPAAASGGITYQELLDTDTRPVPDVLRLCAPADLDTHDIPVERYTSRSFHELEKRTIWARAWQFACREEHLVEPGDHVVYDIAGTSFLIVRADSGPGGIRAYPNACLHRGRQLKTFDGHSSELRCPFHGFAWHLDGRLKHIPAEWDFPHVVPQDFCLPQARVGTWGGFVFVNPDPQAEPLEDFLGVLPAHFERWRLQDRYVAAHVAKVIPCNWKVAQEAFSEAFHVNATHPQLLAGIGDANSQYDVFGNVSRAITPNAVPSPHLAWTPTEQQVMDAVVDRRVDEAPRLKVGDGQRARELWAEASRRRWRQVAPDLVDVFCDSEMADSIYYTVFPNLHPWGALNRICYRFRPDGDDHRSCIMECLLLDPFAGPRPPPAPVHWLGADDPWTDAPELGPLARVFMQDSANMAAVQVGLESTRKPGVTLARYQETKVRHIHALIDRWSAGS